MSLRIAIGESHFIELDPKPLFIPTGLAVQEGERYRLYACGKWKDWLTVCDAKGWTQLGMGWLRRYNRFPDAHWFALIACIGATEKTSRLIGLQAEIDVSAADRLLAGTDPLQLYVFANDWPSMYFNNKIASAEEGGPMRLTITRLA